MSIIEFSDGMKFNTDGEYRIESRGDGLYVVGHGLLSHVDSREEGERFIRVLKGEEPLPGSPGARR